MNPLQVWAPRPERLAAIADGRRIEMIKDADGWWHPGEPVDDLPAEYDYGFLIDDDETPLPDPRSRRQPDGVHGLSRTFDPGAYGWQDAGWKGRQLAGGVIYELHIGTFTAEGTLLSAIDRLDHLVDLGIDFVEPLPVNAFNGDHNWGYDGVGWYAVQESYGGPAGYQQFVDACHRRGLAVIQDVVYNHLGPSGNYLPRFGPYLTSGSQNTWGETLNLDGPDSEVVRRYILDNALGWLRDYHVDGLRIDAVHALRDSRATHLLAELSDEVDALSAQLGRPLTMIAESDLNDPKMITTRQAGGLGMTAQWSDDFHHALYANLTGDASGYYADFDSVGALAKVISRGFYHDGSFSSFRQRRHGAPIDLRHTAGWQLVVCSDNHDQIGNRAAGQRLPTWLDDRQLRLAALITLLGPFTPMIFMGEEWGARTPWQFFTSHPEAELGRIVAEGRIAEFARMDWDTSTVPDPQDPDTFTRSKLDWAEPRSGPQADLLEFHRSLIRLRHRRPELTDPRLDRGEAVADEQSGTLTVRRGRTLIMVNFRTEPAELAAEMTETLITVGDVDHAESTITLGRHSAVVGITS